METQIMQSLSKERNKSGEEEGWGGKRQKFSWDYSFFSENLLF